MFKLKGNVVTFAVRHAKSCYIFTIRASTQICTYKYKQWLQHGCLTCSPQSGTHHICKQHKSLTTAALDNPPGLAPHQNATTVADQFICTPQPPNYVKTLIPVYTTRFYIKMSYEKFYPIYRKLLYVLREGAMQGTTTKTSTVSLHNKRNVYELFLKYFLYSFTTSSSTCGCYPSSSAHHLGSTAII